MINDKMTKAFYGAFYRRRIHFAIINILRSKHFEKEIKKKQIIIAVNF